MKILITYYSRTGGTEKMAEAIKKNLENRGHFVDMERVKPVKEHNFLSWWHIRMVKGECDIQTPKIQDVSEYDVVLIGSPNWTRLSLPMARYLKIVRGLRYKNIGFFSATAAPPTVEWYIVSAYLLDLTFARIIEEKGGRIIDSILLSSVLKRWDFSSKYGEKTIREFCDNITTPIRSFKEYLLEQKEIESNRLIVVTLLLFNFIFLIFQTTSSFLKTQIITWGEFFVFLTLGLFVYVSILTIVERKKAIFLGKYIAVGAAMIFWTLAMLFLEPTLGRVIILGYVFFIMITFFFRNIKTVIFSGLFAIAGYIYLFLNYPVRGVFVLSLDLTLFLIAMGVVAFVTRSLQKHLLSLLETQDLVEEARMSLEIKIIARTRELKELADSLDLKVKERTVELQEKIKELERFLSLTVGRELKMIALKDEIKKLKEELKEKNKQ